MLLDTLTMKPWYVYKVKSHKKEIIKIVEKTRNP